MASHTSRPSRYLLLTFYGQHKLIINTNSTGSLREKSVSYITTILGPFKELELEPMIEASLAKVLQHKYQPFGSKSSPEQRQLVSVQLCLLFTELYKLGWKVVGDSIFDASKRRGNVILR